VCEKLTNSEKKTPKEDEGLDATPKKEVVVAIRLIGQRGREERDQERNTETKAYAVRGAHGADAYTMQRGSQLKGKREDPAKGDQVQHQYKRSRGS